MNNLINVAVLGSTGYVGMELVKILSKHENVKINFLGSDKSNKKYLSNIENDEEYKNLPVLKNNNEFDPSTAEYVFLALPHSISNKYVKKYYGKIKIIDLSADFRLDNFDVYKENYGDNHLCFEYASQFIYGLPEFNKKIIFKANNIAVPGCYPTSILLPIIPLMKDNLIKNDDIIIDSKSGYSGAGKNFDLSNIKSEKDFNFYNYNTNSHRHIAEIKQELEKCNSINNLLFSFNPHILPNFRGMMSTIYCNLTEKINKTKCLEKLRNFSKKNYFIQFIEDDRRLDFFSVHNTNFCKIKIFDHPNKDKIIIVSIIDNLIKGASGQAVQCLNIMENLNEKTALI